MEMEAKREVPFHNNSKLFLPNGIPVRRQVAARAPAEAPEIFCSNNCGAYFLKQTATPTVMKTTGKGLKHFRYLSRKTFSDLTVINAEKAATSKR